MRRSIARTIGSKVLGLALLIGAASAQEPLRYVRANSGGASIRNFQDRQGLVVRDVQPGGLMAVFGESVGFLDVQAEGGFKVWVYGKYLEPLQGDLMRVNAKSVLMRPKPGSSTANMPIRTKLQRGDVVRRIERFDSTIPLEEDWVQVWSPLKARGWVLASDVSDVADAGQAAAAWRQAQSAQPKAAVAASTPRPKPKTPKPQPQTTPTQSKPQEAAAKPVAKEAKPVTGEPTSLLAAADRLFDAALEQEKPEFAPVIAAYEEVLAQAPAGSSVANMASRRLDESRVRAKFVGLQDEVERSKAEHQDRLESIKREQERVELANTTHWGRFNGRGWLEKKVIGSQEHYYLRWAGDTVAEVTCSSGRYDLDAFEGYEIGGMGIQVNQGSLDQLDKYRTPRVLDLMKIEVISASAGRP